MASSHWGWGGGEVYLGMNLYPFIEECPRRSQWPATCTSQPLAPPLTPSTDSLAFILHLALPAHPPPPLPTSSPLSPPLSFFCSFSFPVAHILQSNLHPPSHSFLSIFLFLFD